ncbi:unnamed protein product [Medioppia subpectinata]|uniref:Uncharacterized protein n=1 Tax=Medioppia subpectinata TaxID=1979941 RepID=A0A7R9QJW1_9ACAR|nr:unnamed protein product [Medioppia subpectinata]CAG2122036.1 unnamed protein product [Medioppia subpectinata]
MAHYNMAFAADEFDRMDTSLNDYPEPQQDSAQPNDSTGSSQDNHPSNKTTGSSAKLNGCFTFIDFCPEYRRKPDSWFFQADYESFSEIFHKVNEWLNDNHKWEVKTAETLIYDSTTGFGQKLPFFAGKQVKRNLRGVRY